MYHSSRKVPKRHGEMHTNDKGPNGQEIWVTMACHSGQGVCIRDNIRAEKYLVPICRRHNRSIVMEDVTAVACSKPAAWTESSAVAACSTCRTVLQHALCRTSCQLALDSS